MRAVSYYFGDGAWQYSPCLSPTPGGVGGWNAWVHTEEGAVLEMVGEKKSYRLVG